jgi:branched-chain amino acid transport system permease protein
VSDFLSYLISGLAVGASFSLIASGFVVVHRVTRVVNFTQGTVAVVGGLVASSLLDMRLPHGVAEVLAILAAGLVGLVVGVIAIGKPGTATLTSLIITLGLGVGAYAVEILIWGQTPRSFRMLTGAVTIGGARLQSQYFLIMGATAVTFAALALFFSRTYLGKALTACSSNPYAARLMGVNVTRMGLLAFTLGGALGGLAGVLITPLQSVNYDSDVTLGVNGFAAAVVGGLMSPGLALAGGLLLGLAESFVGGYYDASYQTEVALLLMLALMVWRARRRVSIAEEAA